jgi:hypothetical protein
MRPDFDTNDIEPTGPQRVPLCSVCNEEADEFAFGKDFCAFHFRRELTATSKHLQRMEAQQ